MKWLSLFLLLLGLASPALAGVFELGGTLSYAHSTYNAGSYTTTHSYSGSLGYYFSQDSELEFMYQFSATQDFVPGVQDISYKDQVYSLNFLYYLFEEQAKVKPFFKLGVGELNRTASGTYSGGYTAPGELDQVTVVLGAGLKAKVSQRFALKFDVTTYLSGGALSSYQDNVTFNVGASIYF